MLRDKANAVAREATDRLGLPVCWYAVDGAVYFLYTILTLPPYAGEGRVAEFSVDRVTLDDPLSIAREIQRQARDELMEHQLGEIPGLG